MNGIPAASLCFHAVTLLMMPTFSVKRPLTPSSSHPMGRGGPQPGKGHHERYTFAINTRDFS